MAARKMPAAVRARFIAEKRAQRASAKKQAACAHQDVARKQVSPTVNMVACYTCGKVWRELYAD